MKTPIGREIESEIQDQVGHQLDGRIKAYLKENLTIEVNWQRGNSFERTNIVVKLLLEGEVISESMEFPSL